jgi:aspartate/methionine/tyrosine aminotransferase
VSSPLLPPPELRAHAAPTASGYVPADSLNLGQGFMNWGPAPFLQAEAQASLEQVDANHYSVPRGRIRLRKAISKLVSESYGLGRELDPMTEILVTAGANEGMYAFAAAFLCPGDEVILFEPCEYFSQLQGTVLITVGTVFDQYVAQVRFKCVLNDLPARSVLTLRSQRRNSHLRTHPRTRGSRCWDSAVRRLED